MVFPPFTRIPRFNPPPLEYTLMVEPFKELNENEPEVRLPVPDETTPYTLLVDVPETVVLSTVRTVVLNLAVTDVVPGKLMPVRFTPFTDDVSFNVRSSTRVDSPIVRSVVSDVAPILWMVVVCTLAPRMDTPVGIVIPLLRLYVPGNTEMESPATEDAIAVVIVLNGDAYLFVKALESFPYTESTLKSPPNV
jgi:hypothetical protein